jgi:hypothetical protein
MRNRTLISKDSIPIDSCFSFAVLYMKTEVKARHSFQALYTVNATMVKLT